MNVNTWRVVATAFMTIPEKSDPNVLILLFKIAEVHAWNKLRSYIKALFQHTFSPV